jgi:hypothetical protein
MSKDGSVKTAGGIILRADASESFDSSFMRVFKILTQPSRSALNQVEIFPEAHADVWNSLADGYVAAVDISISWTFGLAKNFFCGLPGYVVAPLLKKAR